MEYFARHFFNQVCDPKCRYHNQVLWYFVSVVHTCDTYSCNGIVTVLQLHSDIMYVAYIEEIWVKFAMCTLKSWCTRSPSENTWVRWKLPFFLDGCYISWPVSQSIDLHTFTHLCDQCHSQGSLRIISNSFGHQDLSVFIGCISQAIPINSTQDMIWTCHNIDILPYLGILPKQLKILGWVSCRPFIQW